MTTRTVVNLIYFAVIVLIVMSIGKIAKTKKLKTKNVRGMRNNPSNCSYSGTENNNIEDMQWKQEELDYWAMENGNSEKVDCNGAMDESMKIITPVEQGGYNMDQGNSFNDFNNGGF